MAGVCCSTTATCSTAASVCIIVCTGSVMVSTGSWTVRLTAAGYTHVYLGAHANPDANSGDHIDAAALAARPDLFRPVYAEGGVQIFALAAAP